MDIISRLISQYLAGKIDATKFSQEFDVEFRKFLKIHRFISSYFNGICDELWFKADLIEIREEFAIPQHIVSMQGFQIVDGQTVNLALFPQEAK
jgi:hypothetical protein